MVDQRGLEKKLPRTEKRMTAIRVWLITILTRAQMRRRVTLRERLDIFCLSRAGIFSVDFELLLIEESDLRKEVFFFT